jgi:thioredoxin 1
MSLPALGAAARRSAAHLLMAHQRSLGVAAPASGASAASPALRRRRRPFSSVAEAADDAALAKALADAAAANAGSVVNYTAAWCGPCKAMAGPMAALAKQHPSVSFIKVDIDSAALQQSVRAAGVTAVPTYVVRKGAAVLETIQGARLELLQKAVEQAAAAK